MSKVDPLSTVATGYSSATALNSNFDKIEEAFDNTLSRDGSGPNFMETELDMNSNRIINLPEPVEPTDAVRLQDITDLAIQLPSENFTFVQAGTGAVSRTIQAKVREIQISPEDFGAVGDNTTDDAAAIQRAIDYLSTTFGGGTLQFGPKSYLISTTLRLYSNIKLLGHGTGDIPTGFVSHIRYTGTGSVFVGDDTTSVLNHIHIEGFTLQADNTTTKVIDAKSWGFSVIRKCWLSGNNSALCSGVIYSCETATTKSITNITRANPGVVTTGTAHGRTTGDQIHISGVLGMTEVNSRYFTITVISPSTFSIGVDTSAYTVYSSAGSVDHMITANTTYNRIEDCYFGFVDYGIQFIDSSNSNIVDGNRIQVKTNGSAVYSYSVFTGFPNANSIFRNRLETGNDPTIGVNLLGTSNGYCIVGNRFELWVASTGISIQATCHDNDIFGNYYSGMLLTNRIQDLSKKARGTDAGFNKAVIKAIINGTTGALIASNIPGVACTSGGTGVYQLTYPALPNSTYPSIVDPILVPKVWQDGAIAFLGAGATFTETALIINYYDAAGAPANAGTIRVEIS